MLAIISTLCACVKSFRRAVRAVKSSVEAVVNEYLKGPDTIDEPVETVSVLQLMLTASLLCEGWRQRKRHQD